ncbi:MAG: Tellurite resistance protein TerB [Deltaproteobacteria bacterium]|nr:MAG: Tellurite resistance protein TerB [Deltaproteobacteria bacterium]
MGFFDHVFDETWKLEEQDTSLNAEEAFAAVAIAMSAVDGNIDDVEIDNLVTYLRRMRLFRDYETQHFVALFERLLRLLHQEGPEQLAVLAEEALPESLRATAFALSLDVALADGVITEEEKKMIQHLRVALNIEEELALKIADVMLIKNRG